VLRRPLSIKKAYWRPYTNKEIIQISKSKPKKISILCTFKGIFQSKEKGQDGYKSIGLAFADVF
jgi:hypothetical protein